MYIVAIGWLWVVLMMSLTETSVTAGILTFFFYGLAPLALFLWLAYSTNNLILVKKQRQPCKTFYVFQA